MGKVLDFPFVQLTVIFMVENIITSFSIVLSCVNMNFCGVTLISVNDFLSMVDSDLLV